MNRKLLLIPLLLAGCGGEDAEFSYPDLIPNEVIYAYPYDGQQSVSRRSPVIVRTGDPLAQLDVTGLDEVAIDAALDAALVELEAAVEARVLLQTVSDEIVPFEARLVVDDSQADVYTINTMVLQPVEQLDAASAYTVNFDGLNLDDILVDRLSFPKSGVTFAGEELDFTTAGVATGPRSMADLNSEFTISRMIPDGEHFPFVDFSALRLQFTQPLDPETVVYGSELDGGTIRLLEESTGDVVPATLLVTGYRVTIDPFEDLEPNQAYTLDVSPGLRSIHDLPLVFEPITLNAGNTAPREIMAQEGILSSDLPESQCEVGAEGVVLSPLNGMPINCVPVASVLLGDESVSQATGDLYAEVAYVPNYPEVTPLRVPRGTILKGTSLQVLVGGNVPVIVDDGEGGQTELVSGEIAMTMVGDANGFLMPNPYSRQYDAPRHVRLFLDVAMTAETDQANGGLSQDILHVEVVGTAMVKDGRMVIDAMAVVEPKVLGLEYAFGVLSFHMESYADQMNAPELAVDDTPPRLQSWVPGEGVDELRPGHPIVLNFSEPLAVETLALDGAMVLTRNESPVEFDWYQDGGTLVIKPAGGLVFSTSPGNSSYRLDLRPDSDKNDGVVDGITDLNGNPLLPPEEAIAFTMPFYGATSVKPFATATLPGFPCATDINPAADLGANRHGRCVSGKSDDDLLPVTGMPANRSIYAQFSQPMSASSITLGQACDLGQGTFHVQLVDAAGVCIEPVAGRLEVFERHLTFTPDAPWEEGKPYRYIMESSGGACGSASMCSAAGSRLISDPLGGQDAVGPDMAIYFRGAPAVDHVFQVADNMPSLDVNGDYLYDAAEPRPEGCSSSYCPTPPNSTRLAITATSSNVRNESIGCPHDQDCPEDQFLYLTGALVADVVGWDETEQAIKVHVYPNLLMATSLKTHVEIGITETIVTVITSPGETICQIPLLNLFCEVVGAVTDTFSETFTYYLAQELDSGPQVMRVRYGGADRDQPLTGWIRETEEGPKLAIDLEVYMDAPDMHVDLAGIELTHDLVSKRVTLNLEGGVSLLPDGRMRIQQTNSNSPNVVVNVTLSGLPAVQMTLNVPPGGASLNYLSQPVKQ